MKIQVSNVAFQTHFLLKESFRISLNLPTKIRKRYVPKFFALQKRPAALCFINLQVVRFKGHLLLIMIFFLNVQLNLATYKADSGKRAKGAVLETGSNNEDSSPQSCFSDIVCAKGKLQNPTKPLTKNKEVSQDILALRRELQLGISVLSFPSAEV